MDVITYPRRKVDAHLAHLYQRQRPHNQVNDNIEDSSFKRISLNEI